MADDAIVAKVQKRHKIARSYRRSGYEHVSSPVHPYPCDLGEADREAGRPPPDAGTGLRGRRGKLHGFWYAFGDADGYVLAEFPSDVVAASTVTKVAASGAFALVSTTKLLTVEEMLEALRDSGGVEYRAPGAVS